MQEILSAKDVIKIGMRGYKEYTDYNWHGRTIHIKQMLQRNDFYQLIHDIEEMCMSSDGDFIYEYLAFAIRLMVVVSYASVELPNNLDEAFKLLYCSDLFDVVRQNINRNQLNDIMLYFGITGRDRYE